MQGGFATAVGSKWYFGVEGWGEYKPIRLEALFRPSLKLGSFVATACNSKTRWK